MKSSQGKKLLHFIINMLPFVVIYILSPYMKYQEYEFIYALSHRNFRYVWLIPAVLISAGRIKRGYICTASAITAMFYARYTGDIKYRLDKMDGFYPHTPHWGIWISTQLYILSAAAAIHLIIHRREVATHIKQIKERFIIWWNNTRKDYNL